MDRFQCQAFSLSIAPSDLTSAMVHACPDAYEWLGDGVTFLSAEHALVAMAFSADQATFRAFTMNGGHAIGCASIDFWTQGLLMTANKAQRRRQRLSLQNTLGIVARVAVTMKGVVDRYGLRLKAAPSMEVLREDLLQFVADNVPAARDYLTQWKGPRPEWVTRLLT